MIISLRFRDVTAGGALGSETEQGLFSFEHFSLSVS